MPISAAEPQLPAADPPPPPLLEIAGLSSGYGKIGVLHGINLMVGAGEVVALAPEWRRAKPRCCVRCRDCCPGQDGCRFAGRDLAGDSPRDPSSRRGSRMSSKDHRVFTQLAVYDNLLLAAYDLPLP